MSLRKFCCIFYSKIISKRIFILDLFDPQVKLPKASEYKINIRFIDFDIDWALRSQILKLKKEMFMLLLFGHGSNINACMQTNEVMHAFIYANL